VTTSSLARRSVPHPKRRRIAERVAERVIALVSATAILGIVLIFAFVAREALPILWEKTTTPTSELVIPKQYDGYDTAEFVWQPVGFPGKHNVVPLFLGTLKITTLAMALSVPLGLLAAIHVALFARPWVRRIVKPVVELLAGVPSVVLGFFALTFVADVTHDTLGTTYRLNAFVAAIALSLAVVPIVFTVAEDALRAVPRSLHDAAYAVGAREWQTVLRVVVPAALPGITAAVVLGFGRAIGETMIVLMASGNAAVTSLSPTTSGRTVTATIAAELGEAPRGGEHWRVLFALGLLLFLTTFVLDQLGQRAVRRLKKRFGPSPEDAP
jgi:phosphate transport system permease protein